MLLIGVTGLDLSSSHRHRKVIKAKENESKAKRDLLKIDSKRGVGQLRGTIALNSLGYMV